MSPCVNVRPLGRGTMDSDELRLLYNTYDRGGVGLINRREFKYEYSNFENYG
eukprot:gene49113-40068_t